MVKDQSFLTKFKYLATDSYRMIWETGNYQGYSTVHQRRIKNFWDTYKHFGFDKKLLSCKSKNA